MSSQKNSYIDLNGASNRPDKDDDVEDGDKTVEGNSKNNSSNGEGNEKKTTVRRYVRSKMPLSFVHAIERLGGQESKFG